MPSFAIEIEIFGLQKNQCKEKDKLTIYNYFVSLKINDSWQQEVEAKKKKILKYKELELEKNKAKKKNNLTIYNNFESQKKKKSGKKKLKQKKNKISSNKE